MLRDKADRKDSNPEPQAGDALDRRGFLAAAILPLVHAVLPARMPAAEAKPVCSRSLPNQAGLALVLTMAPAPGPFPEPAAIQSAPPETRPAQYNQPAAHVLEYLDSHIKKAAFVGGADVADVFRIAGGDETGSYTFQFVEDVFSAVPANPFRPRGARDEPSAVTSAFEFMRTKGIVPGDAFLKSYLCDQNPLNVRAALGFLSARPDIPVDFTVLDSIARSRGGAAGSALECMAARQIQLPERYLSGLWANHQPDESSAQVKFQTGMFKLLRAARPSDSWDIVKQYFADGKELADVLEIIKSDPGLMNRLRCSEIISRARTLDRTSLYQANEMRCAELLLLKSQAAGQLPRQIGAEEAYCIKMPVLKYAEAIDQRFPGYLAGLSDTQMGLLLGEIAAEIVLKRRMQMQKPLIDSKTDLLVVLHEEADFREDEIVAVAEKFGARVVKVIKGGRELGTAAKQEYLDALEALSMPPEDGRRAVIWHSVHGGRKHSWLYSGQIEDSDSDNVRHPEGVSFQEAAEKMISARFSGGPAQAQGTIDFSHMTFILDQCFPYDFAKGDGRVIDTLFALSNEIGRRLAGVPEFIPITQLGMPSNKQLRGGKLPERMLAAPIAPGEPFRHKDFFRIDMELAAEYREQLLKMGNPGGVKFAFGSQDPALISSEIIDLDHSMEEKVRKLHLPPLPDQRQAVSAALMHTVDLAQADTTEDSRRDC